MRNLGKRGCTKKRSCYWCVYREENALHLITDCWKSKALGTKLGFPESIFITHGEKPTEWIERCAEGMEAYEFRKLMSMMWVIWMSRNELIHKAVDRSVEQMAGMVEAMMFQGDKWGHSKMDIRLSWNEAILTSNDLAGWVIDTSKE